LRLLVLATYLPAPALSSFMARHMLQPAPRHSKPASAEDAIQPLSLGLTLDIALEPGTTIASYIGARHALALDDLIGGGAQVFDAPVRTRANEDNVDRLALAIG
jgi:hypothetical protein